MISWIISDKHKLFSIFLQTSRRLSSSRVTCVTPCVLTRLNSSKRMICPLVCPLWEPHRKRWWGHWVECGCTSSSAAGYSWWRTKRTACWHGTWCMMPCHTLRSASCWSSWYPVWRWESKWSLRCHCLEQHPTSSPTASPSTAQSVYLHPTWLDCETTRTSRTTRSRSKSQLLVLTVLALAASCSHSSAIWAPFSFSHGDKRWHWNTLNTSRVCTERLWHAAAFALTQIRFDNRAQQLCT